MPRFVLRDKIFGLGGDLTITDDQGREVYFVDGAVISIGRRLQIKDLNGGVLATIQQRVIAMRPTFEIHLPGGVNVTIAKRLLSLFVDRIKIDIPGPNDLEAHGDIFHHEYEIDQHGRTVARVTKRWISLVDTYGVEVADDVDPLLILCSAVVIDELLDQERREHDHD